MSNARGYTSADDLEEDEDNLPAESADLLQLEKVIKAGYLLKKGEKRRVRNRELSLWKAATRRSHHDSLLTLPFAGVEASLVCTTSNQDGTI